MLIILARTFILLIILLNYSKEFWQIRLHFQTIIIQQTNARMMTFQSLLSQLNLKRLVPALNKFKTRPTLPFYVLKLNPYQNFLANDCALSISKKLSNSTLASHQGPLTVWSPYHLHRIIETVGDRPQRRIILKNPFKSQELLWQALSMGVKEMVINTREQLTKIQNFKKKSSHFRDNCIKYFWAAEDYSQNIQELQSVQQYVSGLYFQAQNILSHARIEEITKKVLLKGAKLQQVIREGKLKELNDLKEWKREQLFWRNRTIKKTIDVCDLSEVENFILVTRSLSQSKLVINEEARKLIQGIDVQLNSLIVAYEKEQWLFSSLKQFPIDQQKFLFEIQPEPTTAGNFSKPLIS